LLNTGPVALQQSMVIITGKQQSSVELTAAPAVLSCLLWSAADKYPAHVQQCAAAGQQVQLAWVVWRLYLHILDSLIRDGHFDTPLLGWPVNTGRVCMVALRWQSL
jgi:hypothetical protein